MNDEDHSDRVQHVQVGQGILANNHSTISTGDIHYHNHDGGIQTRQPTLRDLLSFPEMQSRERRVEIAHDGTCEWFVHTQEYSTWTESPRNDWRDSIIWVRGNAGAGKSTLMKFAVEYAREATPDDLVLPHFFNARGQALEHSTEGMFRTLIVWLLDELPARAVEGLSSAYKSYSSKQWDVPELERLLKKALKELVDRPIAFYIDALDECDETEVDRMLWVFCDIAKKFHESGQRIRVCLASRPYPAIIFTNAIFLDLRHQTEHLADIDRYITDRLQIGNNEIALAIQRQIRQKARGIFMWVVLVVKLLNTEFRNGNVQNLQERLMEIPSGLRSLFVYTLERYQDDRPAMLVCFRWLLFGRGQFDGPTRLWWTMQLGLGRPGREIAEEHDELDHDAMERQIVSKTKGFVEFNGLFWQFVHESIREFILKEYTLLGAEHPSEFEATSHELIRDWWSAEVLACQPMVLDFVSRCDEYGEVTPGPEGFRTLRMRPYAEIAAAIAVNHAEIAQECGRDQGAWLNNFSHIAGPYLVTSQGLEVRIVHDMMSLLLHARCETLIRETQLESVRRGRCDGLAFGFKDIAYEGLCPALWSSLLNEEQELSKALVDLYLTLEPRSSRLQSLMQEEASDLSLSLTGKSEQPYSIPLLDLACFSPRLATFFLLALTPPSALEPHLDMLECIFEENSAHFILTLDLVIEEQLPTDAIDYKSPKFMDWVEAAEEKSRHVSVLTKIHPVMAEMRATLRSFGVRSSKRRGHHC